MYGIWGDTKAVYAVGGGGTIVHASSGKYYSFKPQVSGTSNTLRAVWGSSHTDVFAVGDNGVILRRIN